MTLVRRKVKAAFRVQPSADAVRPNAAVFVRRGFDGLPLGAVWVCVKWAASGAAPNGAAMDVDARAQGLPSLALRPHRFRARHAHRHRTVVLIHTGSECLSTLTQWRGIVRTGVNYSGRVGASCANQGQ